MLSSDWWSYKLAPVLKVVDLMKSIWVMGERAWNSTNLTQPKTFSSTLFWASSPTIWRFLWHPHQYFGQISVALSHFDNIFLSLHQYKEISTKSDEITPLYHKPDEPNTRPPPNEAWSEVPGGSVVGSFFPHSKLVMSSLGWAQTWLNPTHGHPSFELKCEAHLLKCSLSSHVWVSVESND